MRILVVEDDPDINRQLTNALSEAGYAVDSAKDGEDGYFLGDTEPYDVVILDTGSVYGAWSLSQARAATDLLLVTTNELPALQAAQRALSYLEANKIGKWKTRLVVNRYQRDVGLSREVIGTALHTDVFETLPSDYDAVQKALMEGSPKAGEEMLSSEEKESERIMLEIRLPSGIKLASLKSDQAEKLSEFLEAGELDARLWESGIVALTPKGRLVADRIVRKILF